MNSVERRKWDIRRRPVPAFASLALLLLVLLFTGSCSAQTITPPPGPVDPTKPVVLTVTSADTQFFSGVKSVTVGGLKATAQGDAAKGIVTVTDLPRNLKGQQPLQLFGQDDKPLGPQVLLTFPGDGGSNTTPSPTPDPNLYEKLSAVERQNALVKMPWYYTLIIIAFAVVLGAFVMTIVKAVLFSRATFRSPLGLPVGSFRAILAYTLVAFLGFYVLTSLLTISVFAPPDFLLGIVATVVGFYFGSRTGEEGVADERAGIVRGVVRRGTPGGGTPGGGGTPPPGAPVSGALVKFRRDDGAEPYSRLTDVDGRFVLQGVRPGKYKVIATVTSPAASGQQEITVTEGSDQEVEIVITSAASAGGGGTTGGQSGGAGGGGAGGGTTPPAGVDVKGRVVQSDGKTPIAGANVVLSQGGVEKGKATSGQDGSYTIDKKVEAGKYKIVASAVDFAPATLDDVDVKAGQEKIVPDLKLNKV